MKRVTLIFAKRFKIRVSLSSQSESHSVRGHVKHIVDINGGDIHEERHYSNYVRRLTYLHTSLPSFNYS